MYQVSERVKKQFEYTMSIPCVKEAMKFIQDDERNTIEEQKELVLIEAPTREEEKRAAVMMENLKLLALKMFTLTAVEMLLAFEEEAAKDRRY